MFTILMECFYDATVEESQSGFREMVDTSEITLQLHPLNDAMQVTWLCAKLQGYGIFVVAGTEQYEGVFLIRVHTLTPDSLLPFLQSLPGISEAKAEPAVVPSLVTRIHVALAPDFGT